METGNIKQVSGSKYLVRSKTTAPRNLEACSEWFEVTWLKGQWRCDCQNSRKWKRKCDHLEAVIFLLKLPHILFMNENYDLLCCPKCSAEPDNIVSNGDRANKSGTTHRFVCRGCGYSFTDRLGFAKMRSNPLFIVLALDLFYKGLSVRQVEHHLSSVYGSEISHMSVHRWVTRYVSILSKFIENEITPNVSKNWHADEMVLKVNGRRAYLWNTLDRRTKYLLASMLASGRGEEEAYQVLSQSLDHAKNKANRIISDGLKSYVPAMKRLGIPKHVSSVALSDCENNNVMERTNQTLRTRYKTMRGLKKLQSEDGISEGLRLYYNFIRPHTALAGQTPSEKAGIHLRGRNRWLSLAVKATQTQEHGKRSATLDKKH